MHLSKHVQGLYAESYKIKVKEIKKERNEEMYHIHELEYSIY